jgi:hypothetical protein
MRTGKESACFAGKSGTGRWEVSGKILWILPETSHLLLAYGTPVYRETLFRSKYSINSDWVFADIPSLTLPSGKCFMDSAHALMG